MVPSRAGSRARCARRNSSISEFLEHNHPYPYSSIRGRSTSETTLGLSERENVARWICLPVKIPSSTAGTPSPGTFNLIKRILAGGLYRPAVHGTGQGDTGVWERSFHCPSLLLHASSVGQYLMAGITPSSEYNHHRCTTVARTHYTDDPGGNPVCILMEVRRQTQGRTQQFAFNERLRNMKVIGQGYAGYTQAL